MSTQEKLRRAMMTGPNRWAEATINGKLVSYYEIHDETILFDLIDSAKREGAIEIRNLYGSPKCEALHHPKKYQHTALEDCPVEKEINALTEQSKESE